MYPSFVPRPARLFVPLSAPVLLCLLICGIPSTQPHAAPPSSSRTTSSKATPPKPASKNATSKKAAAKKPPAVTVADRLAEVGEEARDRLKPWFEDQDVTYPPAAVTLVGLKDERLLKVYARSQHGEWRFILQYPVAAASGEPGPKLQEGDMQVPEGVYSVTYLNPASLFHLSLALDYPNSFDRLQAKKDKRRNLGGDIMIHGSWYSEGCLAVGDTAAEDLFVLAADTRIRNVRVVITPFDFRISPVEVGSVTDSDQPKWVGELYADLSRELASLSDGISTQAQLVQYADAFPPAPPDDRPPIHILIDLLLEALTTLMDGQTSGTETAEPPRD